MLDYGHAHKKPIDEGFKMSGNPQLPRWRSGMSRSPMGVTSDILGLKVLVRDTVAQLQQTGELAPARRKSLAECFHRYIENASVHRIRPNGISKSRFGHENIAARVVRITAGNEAATLLSLIDKFSNANLEAPERDKLVEFLSRVNVALDHSRASIPSSRYL